MTGQFSYLLNKCFKDNSYNKKHKVFQFIVTIVIYLCLSLIIVFGPLFFLDTNNSFYALMFFIPFLLLILSVFIIYCIQKKLDFLAIQSERIECVSKVINDYIKSLNIKNLTRKQIIKVIISEGEATISEQKLGITFTNTQTLLVIPIILAFINIVFEYLIEYSQDKIEFVIAILISVFIVVSLLYVLEHMFHYITNTPNKYDTECFLSYVKLFCEETESSK